MSTITSIGNVENTDRLKPSGLKNNSVRWFEPGKRVTKLRADDAGLFGATWWPYAGYKELQIATYLSIFVSRILRSLGRL